ncbi:DUF305 domain-containing protein (plasmid) [Coraliomargarita sp. W4R53]
MKKLRLLALATPLALALVLAGCTGSIQDSDSNTSSSAEATSFNAADSMFAMMMIPHHEQAVEMSDMVLAKDDIDPRVQELAAQIKDAQAPEIELMQSWLTAWGMPDAGDMGDMGGMDGMDGMGSGDGMMSGDDMSALETADGSAAAQLFLQQMIVHHDGAIDMAQAEIDAGMNPDAVALAEAIIDAQTAEIATMQDLLAQI